MNRHRKKVSYDANHHDIADALRRIGCTVIDMASLGGGVGDLLAVDRRAAVLHEIKTPAGSFDLHQLRYLAEFRGYATFSVTAEDAIRTQRQPEIYALTEKQKLLILRLVAGYERDYDRRERERGKKIERRRISVAQFETDFESAL